ncbi:hypothetical protein JB92DRAFT_1235578 [Gautieria morchelliformis]|nr:hypothetical protein JB92DRAFT_1235578 [Gautieria morchelliformis]
MSELPAYAEQLVLILLAGACYSFFLPGNRILCRTMPTRPRDTFGFGFPLSLPVSAPLLPFLFFSFSLSMLSHFPFPPTFVPTAVLAGVSWRRFTVHQ